MRRINKCSFLSIFALIYFKLLLQIVLLFSVKYCTLAIESNRQKHFLIAKTSAKTVKIMLIEFIHSRWRHYIAGTIGYIQDGTTEIASRYDQRTSRTLRSGEKAFDTDENDTLSIKSQYCGLRGSCQERFTSYLKGLSQTCQIHYSICPSNVSKKKTDPETKNLND